MKIVGATQAATMAAMTVIFGFAGLAAPDAALAARSPSHGEQAAIIAAAVSADGSPQQRVRVSDVRISTDGPWAAASVSIYRRGSSQLEQAEEDTFYRVHGSWIDMASADAPNIAMPAAVERDLGLANSEFGGTYFKVYLILCWLLGLGAIWDVLLQPRSAFKQARHSKLRWLAIELLGVVPAGIFTWGYYAIRIRPGVVRAGGRPPRTILKALLRGLSALVPDPGTPVGGPPARTPTRSPPVQWDSKPKSERDCTSCGGKGKHMCNHCQGRGFRYEKDPTKPYGPSVAKGCPACGTKGGFTCGTCKGTGKLPGW